MSAITTQHDSGLTLADLEGMPDDGRRYELVGGAIVMTPAPTTVHQRILRELLLLLHEACPPDHELFPAPVDLDLPGGQRVEPDLVVVPKASVTTERLRTPVLLVVEIVSGGSRTLDRVTKVAAYAEAAIPAYWIVDPLAGRITALRFAGDAYEPYAEGPAISVEWPLVVDADLGRLSSG